MKKLLTVIAAMLLSCPAIRADDPNESKVVQLRIKHKEVIKEEAPPSNPNKKDTRKIRVEKVPMPYDSLCSGAFISPTGFIITAKHCVDGDIEKVDVFTKEQRTYKARIVAISDKQDLALIHVGYMGSPYFKLADTTTKGEEVYVLGSPLGILNVISRGIVAKLSGDVTLVDCSVLPGNSGGPAINANGELIGVVSAGFVVMLGMTHLNILQSLDSVRFFIMDYNHEVSHGK